MGQLAQNGAQPQKQPKYIPLHTGRLFNGIYTNRSPLRDATIQANYTRYGFNSNDALIAGANLEITNRLTLARRPGNPLYDTTAAHKYNNPDSFDEFRVNKAQSDVFGTTLESILTMVDEGGPIGGSHQPSANYLYSLTSGFQRGGDSGYHTGLKFQKSSDSSQSYMQSVGNSLYFADGVDNKKWLTSLFTRTSAGNNNTLQGADGLAGTYPFGTFLVDPANGNLQQFIGINIGAVTNVKIVGNVLTLTVTMTNDVNDYAVGTTFQLFGMTSHTYLEGQVVTLTSVYTHASSTTFVCDYEYANVSSSAESGPGYIVQTGTVPVIAKTGSTVPTWGTTVPSASNNFEGSITQDGNTLWINRGQGVQNWGIKAPTTAPAFQASGSELSWQKDTFYSPVSVFIDTHNNLWQVTTPGMSGSSLPSFSASPTPVQKVVINSVYSNGTTLFFTTDTQSPLLSAGDVVVLKNMCTFGPNNGGTAVTPNLDGISLTVLSSGLSSTAFEATYTSSPFGSSGHPIREYGQAVKSSAATTQADGGVVWTCIQLSASLSWQSGHHYNVGDFLVANNCLFELAPKSTPWIVEAIDCYYMNGSGKPSPDHQDSDWQGAFFYFNSADPNPFTGSYSYIWPGGYSPTHTTLSSLWMGAQAGTNGWSIYAVDGAGDVATSGSGIPLGSDCVSAIRFLVFIPQPGAYTFTMAHGDGAIFAFDSKGIDSDTVSGGAFATTTKSNVPQSYTAKYGYGKGDGSDLCGTNRSTGSGTTETYFGQGLWGDSATWTFPQAGAYAIEIDTAKWYHSGGALIFMCPGSTTKPTQAIPVGEDISGPTTPSFPAFTKAGATFNVSTQEITWGAKVVEVQTGGQAYTWNNLGPTSDFAWIANTNYTLPGTNIIDSNGNQQGAYESGATGTTQPTWATSVGSLTADNNPPLTWIAEGSVPASTQTGNTISASSQQGWLYWIALVNTLDQTVSNVGPVSKGTGPITKGQITFAPGAGLPTDLSAIDPQADYVAIFRSADGFTTPFLIPGFGNSPYTVPLVTYLNYGFVDTVPDTELNILLQGAQAGENTPPAVGAINLTYHLNRIWYSIGNVVYWTTGPLAPIGNGTDGAAPGNFAACPSLVKRLVPTAIGMLAFTVSDIYIIPGNGTTSSPILPAIPYLAGVGLGNYNALDVNGGLIGFFTTDSQFLLFDPGSGLHYVGFNIGDQFRQNNNEPGTSWNPQTAYVAWHVSGEDAGWYVGDAQNGWFRVISTPAPEQGSVAWSPFATISGGGAGAIASIEVSPGVHNLLVGQPTGINTSVSNSGSPILYRNLSATTDGGSGGSNGTPYSAYAVIGSIVLANPGEIAKVAFITTVSVKTGSPLIIGVILDEALPYFTGSFDMIKRWTKDPPNLPQSRSFWRQRFYLSDNEKDAAYCHDLQILVQWPAEAAQNELQTFTIYGTREVEL